MQKQNNNNVSRIRGAIAQHLTKKCKINICLFGIILFSLLLLHLMRHVAPETYCFDARNYWQIGQSLFNSGEFAFENISTGFRGYAFPAFLGFCWLANTTLDITYSYSIFSSLILSILLTVYLNMCFDLFGKKKYTPRSIISRSICAIALTVFFFYGLFLYPLSDLYAALLCICAGYLVYQSQFKDNRQQYIYLFFAGGIAYLSYNVRTIYQIALFSFVILFFVLYIKKVSLLRLVSLGMVFIFGALIAAIPQIIVNWSLSNTPSPWVDNNNLFIDQLKWGLEWSKYATYAGPEGTHIPQMYFLDPDGTEMVAEWDNNGLPTTLQSYIKMIIRHPFGYLMIMIRHICNAAFIFFPEQYVFNLDKNLLWLGLLSLIVIWLFILLLITKRKIHKARKSLRLLVLLITLTLPSIAILFGCVEERFLVLPYMLIYGFLAFFDYAKLRERITKRKVVLGVLGFFAFSTPMVIIEASILSSLVDYPLSFS